MATILIVDDDQGHRAMLRATLRAEGYETIEAGNGEEGVARVSEGGLDLVLLDLRMPRMDGTEALPRIRELNPALPVLIMTAFGSVDTAVDALKSGAYDYLTKPLDTDSLLIAIGRTIEHFELKAENRVLKSRLKNQGTSDRFIGKSKAVRELLDVASAAAPSEANILLTGESGTGKDLVARIIHDSSDRKDGPFIAVSCAAIPESLLESELFGHERGAFTGAVRQHIGKFEQASAGTIFLDEIGEMPTDLQAKLLRVLQSRQVDRIGSEQTVTIDVRVISATNVNLEKAVADGGFRQDLYYRLAVIPIHLPPLRERRSDIAPLAVHFLEMCALRNNRSVKGFSPRAMDALTQYAWPGNARELENAVERAVVLGHDEFVDETALPDHIRSAPDAPSDGTGVRAGNDLESVVRDLILKTLEQTDGNRSEAARLLGISRQTLITRLKGYGRI